MSVRELRLPSLLVRSLELVSGPSANRLILVKSSGFLLGVLLILRSEPTISANEVVFPIGYRVERGAPPGSRAGRGEQIVRKCLYYVGDFEGQTGA